LVDGAEFEHALDKCYLLLSQCIMLKCFLFVLSVLRAGRSVWYDRHVGIVEAAGSNPAQSTTTLHENAILTRASTYL
jgi:hypothetical protein